MKNEKKMSSNRLQKLDHVNRPLEVGSHDPSF